MEHGRTNNKKIITFFNNDIKLYIVSHTKFLSEDKYLKRKLK
jgi:hypothetical protein